VGLCPLRLGLAQGTSKYNFKEVACLVSQEDGKNMVLEKHQIRLVVYRSIDRTNELLFDENAVAKEDATILVGDNSPLDSMGVINFLVALEEELAHAGVHETNLLRNLSAEGLALPRWETVGDLIDFLFELLRGEHGESVEGLSP